MEENAVDFKQYIKDYPPPLSDVDEDDEDPPQKYTYFYWVRQNKWGQEEKLILRIFADKVTWFMKKRKNKKVEEKEGSFVHSTIECVDMAHKFFQDEDE